MAEQDILTFAYGSFFLGLFLSSLLTLASAGALLLNYDTGNAQYQDIADMFSVRSEQAKITGFLENMIGSTENPLAFDVVLTIINIGLFILKMVDFILTVLVNYFLLSFWLSQSGTPGAITGLLVFVWQFWTFWYISKFAFKDRIGGS